MRKRGKLVVLLGLCGLAGGLAVFAILAGRADSNHAGHQADEHHAQEHHAGGALPPGVTEGGQAAFAAIQQIAALLAADPATDWDRVDLEGLRLHLIDMDNVTLRAAVAVQNVDGGARFTVTAAAPDVTASIRRMVLAHAAAMTGADGMRMEAAEIPGGARLEVTGPDARKIRGLGFIGLMTVGMHHQAHHLALARGADPHAH